MDRELQSWEQELIDQQKDTIAELDERLRVQDQWRQELEQRIEELEKVEKAARNLLLQLNEGSVDDECLAADELDEALEALEGSNRDG